MYRFCLNHHLSGLFGVNSLAWAGHLVHVAIPGSRGEYVRWNNFLSVLPHPQGLGPLFTGTESRYSGGADCSSSIPSRISNYCMGTGSSSTFSFPSENHAYEQD